jgi:hypothetical protein
MGEIICFLSILYSYKYSGMINFFYIYIIIIKGKLLLKIVSFQFLDLIFVIYEKKNKHM